MAVVVTISGFALLPGCGGGSSTDNAEKDAGGEQGQQGQAKALAQVPEADQTAFIQLATVIGVLRARAAPVAVGTSRRLGSAAPLIAGRMKVAALRPQDRDLTRLRDRLLPLLTRFSRAPSSGPASRRAARAAIAEADRIEAGLRHYSQVRPAVGGLIPD
ncbi:MAG: hypothetical protein QOD60_1917 [Solirubrobacterales bacterium]|nr:hypothetical protein [Solirubrobacterales bacterium]